MGLLRRHPPDAAKSNNNFRVKHVYLVLNHLRI